MVLMRRTVVGCLLSTKYQIENSDVFQTHPLSSSPLVDCIMSPWTVWSQCSVSCGLGSLFRRACFPRACPGLSSVPPETHTHTYQLPIVKCTFDGHWSVWTEWSECDAQCGGGGQAEKQNLLCSSSQERGTRLVQPCPGDSTEARHCFSPCIPDGVWSKWTAWSECSKTCFHHVDDVGIRRRFRSCNHTVTLSNHPHVHSICHGGTEEQDCILPVNGGWSAWSPWSQCSSGCDSGVQTRERFCNLPSPQHGGSSCPGPHIQTRDCNSHPCSGLHSTKATS
uniref:Thrombospondin, type I, domain containing 7Ba n=1 Tax=Sphaeramia orbicularis TaxID=375764 RepID=A0A673AJX6_9TELE